MELRKAVSSINIRDRYYSFSKDDYTYGYDNSQSQFDYNSNTHFRFSQTSENYSDDRLSNINNFDFRNMKNTYSNAFDNHQGNSEYNNFNSFY